MRTILKVMRALVLVASVSLVVYSIYLKPGVEYVMLTVLVGVLTSVFGIKVTQMSLEEVEEFDYGKED